MKVVVDIFGGDNAPAEILKGSMQALAKDKDLTLVLVGDEVVINKYFDDYLSLRSRIEIVDAKDVITNDDVPTMAIKQKKESSLVKAFEYVKTNSDAVGLVSAGSTGAILTGGVLKVGRIRSVPRPALAPILPTFTGGDVLLIDCGANMDCLPEYLVSFALMGSSYMRSVYGIENPRVGLVSVGTEDKKGNEQTKTAFKLLKEAPINFVGNMEARDALSGEYDVLVCDGFVGNVLLKSTEGTAKLMTTVLKECIMESFSAKIGSLFMKKALKKMKSRMDYNAKGGAPFLGLEKIVVKSHGSSKANAIEASILQVVKMANGNLVNAIKTELDKLFEQKMATAEQKTATNE